MSAIRGVAALGLCALAATACSTGIGDDPTIRATGSPTASVSPAPTSPSPTRAAPPVTIAFGGDVHFEGAIASRLAADPATVFGPIADVLRHADLAVVNLETAVTTGGTPAAKQFTFRAPPTAFTALKAAGIDVATQANNHGEDYGMTGLHDGLAAAKAAGFPLVGVGSDEAAAFAPYVATVRGQRIAVIGATQVLDSDLAAAWTAGPGKPGLASAKDVPRLVSAVRAIRPDVDTVVVDLHWGRELDPCPLDRQRSLAGALANAGADVIVGSHAHVLVGAGWLGHAYVDYGLGNFLFYARGSGPTVDSGVLTLTVRGRAVSAVQWAPARISAGVPRPREGAAAAAAVSAWQQLRGCTGLAASPPPPDDASPLSAGDTGLRSPGE